MIQSRLSDSDKDYNSNVDFNYIIDYVVNDQQILDYILIKFDEFIDYLNYHINSHFLTLINQNYVINRC